MATDQEPHIAADGVQQVPLTIARPLLTRIIEQLREDGLTTSLTVRGRRRVYLVSPEDYALLKAIHARPKLLTCVREAAEADAADQPTAD